MPSRKQSRKRILGEHFREDGSPKRAFATEAEALEHIRRFGHNCIPYPCSICGRWHLATNWEAA